jgi:hypothetical protein
VGDVTKFSRREADVVLAKLHAQVTSSHHVMGVVHLKPGFRLRLYYSHSSGEFPPFVRHKWRQRTRLTSEEFQSLHGCKLDGDQALTLMRERYDL